MLNGSYSNWNRIFFSIYAQRNYFLIKQFPQHATMCLSAVFLCKLKTSSAQLSQVCCQLGWVHLLVLQIFFFQPPLLSPLKPEQPKSDHRPSFHLKRVITIPHPALTSSTGGGSSRFVGKLPSPAPPASGKCQASICGRKCHNVLWGQLNEIKSGGGSCDGSWTGRGHMLERQTWEKVPNQTWTELLPSAKVWALSATLLDFLLLCPWAFWKQGWKTEEFSCSSLGIIVFCMLDMCHFHNFLICLGFFLWGLQEQSLRYDKMLLGCSPTGDFCNYHNRTHSVMSRCVVCCACTCENYSGQRVELVLTSSGLDLFFLDIRCGKNHHRKSDMPH